MATKGKNAFSPWSLERWMPDLSDYPVENVVRLVQGYTLNLKKVLEEVCNNPSLGLSVPLGSFYSVSHEALKRLLHFNRKDFRDYLKDFEMLPDKTISPTKGADIVWNQTYSPAIYRILARASDYLIRRSVPQTMFTTPQLKELLQVTEACINEHKRKVREELLLSARIEEPISDVVNNTHEEQAGRGLFQDGSVRWEEITMQFLDGNTVQITAPKGFKRLTTMVEMDLCDRTKKPVRGDEQWEFLRKLARSNGEITTASPYFKEENVTYKSRLSKKLRVYFGLKDDPFYPYKSEKAYRLKFEIIHENDSLPKVIRIQNAREFEEEDEFGIKEALNEHQNYLG